MTDPIKQNTLGLYLHIPWCPTRCIYCDFNTYVDDNRDLKQRYHTALLREIREAGDALERPHLDTIFIGGGTPTTLTPAQLGEIVATVQASFTLRPDAEITSEANPGTLSLEYLRELRQTGINRLSLGVQSFNNDELAFLSRLHNADIARQAIEQARTAGFENLSFDLILNLPQQTLDQWQHNLAAAIELSPDHLSIYSLIVEPGTPLHRQVQQGHVPEPDDDLAAEMFEHAVAALDAVGYAHYEISNWARRSDEDTPSWKSPRLASAHNLVYWRNQPYLGLGAGAYGTVNGTRWMNVKRPMDYIKRVEAGGGLGPARDERTVEAIERETALSEHMLLGLRLLREGISAAAFEARFGASLAAQFPDAIQHGLERSLLEWIDTPTDCHLRLTREARFLANQAIRPFME